MKKRDGVHTGRFIKIFICIMIGILIGGVGVVFAYNYHASNVGYTKNVNGTQTQISVEDALNDLYAMNANSKSGILTLTQTGKIEIDCGFKPKYVMITHELANGDAAKWNIFYYNEKISNNKSYAVWTEGTDKSISEFDMEFNNNIASDKIFHIYDINNNGFGYYSVYDDGRKLYWTAFK